jgi:hypothetical protein
MPARLSSFLDKSAMTLSGLCLVHCLAGTLLLTVFAASSEWLSHNVHLVGLAIALPLAAVALWRGVMVHGRIGVAILGAFGIAVNSVTPGHPVHTAMSETTYGEAQRKIWKDPIEIAPAFVHLALQDPGGIHDQYVRAWDLVLTLRGEGKPA